MNLSELIWRTRLLAGTAREDDGQEAPNEAYDAVNDAYLTIVDAEPWPFLRDTIELTVDAGEREVALPRGVAYVLTVADGEEALSPRMLEAFHDLEWWKGRPREYAVDHGRLWVRPAPARRTTLHVVHTQRVEPMHRDGDEPVFDSTYHPAIAFTAAADLLERRPEDDPRIERYRERAEAIVQSMRDFYRGAHDRQPIVMGGRDHERPASRHPGRGGRRRERVR